MLKLPISLRVFWLRAQKNNKFIKSILLTTPIWFPAKIGGGPVESVRKLALLFAGLGFRVFILTTNFYARQDKINSKKTLFSSRKMINVIKFNIYNQKNIFLDLIAKKFCYTQEIKCFIEENIKKFDYVCTQGPFVYITYKAIKEAVMRKIPVAYHMRGMLQKTHFKKNYLLKSLYYYFIEHLNLKRSDLLVALSENEVKTYKKLVPKKIVCLIPNIIDCENSLLEEVPFVKSLSNSDVLLTYIGRIDPWKKIDLLLHAFQKIRESSSQNIFLAIAGHGEKSYIKKLFKNKSNKKNVILLPFLNQAKKNYLLKRTKVFIYLSKGEGLSMSILEALQRRVPVVCSDDCNFDEIKKYKCGFSVKTKKDDIVEKVLLLIENQKEYIKAKANTKKAVKHFSKAKITYLWKKNFLSR